MKKINLLKKAVQIVSIFLICIVDIYLSCDSEYIFSVFCGIIVFISVGCIILKKNKKILYLLFILGVPGIGYNLYTAQSMILQNAVTYKLINTQSCWYNEGNPLHRDVLLHTLLRNKVAVLSGDDIWYYKFVKVFSGEIEIDKELSQENVDKDLYVNIGAIRMRSLKDLLPDDVYQILDEGVSNGNYQKLFVDLNGFDSADKVAVLSDGEFNIYLKKYEK